MIKGTLMDDRNDKGRQGAVRRRDVVAGMAAAALAAPIAAQDRPQRVAGRAINRVPETVDVVVIGAGLAGLNAALLLEEAGSTVAVLEGAPRLGGRVLTADNLPLRPEFGASQIGPSYARTIDLCRRFSLALVPEDRTLLGFASRIRGQWVSAENWSTSPVNPLKGPERTIQPVMLGRQMLAKYNRLKSLDDWLDPRFADLDVSIATLLRREGHGDDMLRLVDIAANGDLFSGSCLSLMQETTRGALERTFNGEPAKGEGSRPYENGAQPAGRLALISNVSGGSSRLIEAMAGAIKGPLLTRKLVGAIDATGPKVRVECVDGSAYLANRVVAAVPFSMLRAITVTPGFVGVQDEAVRLLPYANTTRAFGIIRGAYWEQDGLDPSFVSDEAIEAFWAIRPRADESFHRFMVVFTGAQADLIDSLPTDEAQELILRQIARMRPSTAGKLEMGGMYGWGRDFYVRGCRHLFAPGQVTRFARDMIKPHARVHLAGEHTRRVDYGMEAALESGERAAVEILEAAA